MSEMTGISAAQEMAEMAEPDLVAEIYEQIASVPVTRQLRVLEFVWLNAASHERASQAANPKEFAGVRGRQLAALHRMIAIVRDDVAGL